MTTIFTHTPRAPLVNRGECGYRQFGENRDFPCIAQLAPGASLGVMRLDREQTAKIIASLHSTDAHRPAIHHTTGIGLTAAQCLELARCLVDAAHDIETRQVDIQEGKPGACGKGIQ